MTFKGKSDERGQRPMSTETVTRKRTDDNLNPAEAKLPLRINGIKAAEFIKRAYGLGGDLGGAGRYDQSDPVQTELRHIKGWIEMAERDALDARKAS
jgi:hypothetical protein